MAAYDDEPEGASTFLQGEKVIQPEVYISQHGIYHVHESINQ